GAPAHSLGERGRAVSRRVSESEVMRATRSGFTEIAVLGAGTMGRGIAQVAAQAGLKVRLFDVAPEVLAAGHAAALAGIARFEAKGTLSAEAAAAARGRLGAASELEEAVRGADLAIEAVPESLELKRDLFARVEPLLAEGAL